MSGDTKGKLIKLSEGERYKESWLLRQGGFTQSELNTLVDDGIFVRIDKDPNDFMSDNWYVFTGLGQEIAWGR